MFHAISNSLAASVFHGFRFGGGRGGTQVILLVVGLGFAGLLVWAIQRSGKSTT
jgi:hypothetical protein